MKRFTLITPVLFSAVWMILAATVVAQHDHPAGEPEKLGKVNFPTSCDAAVQPQFSSAVAMLHSFWYEKAAEAFTAVAEKDATCGMAYWGVAMTHYHPIWEAPGPNDLKAGWAAVEKAKSLEPSRRREQDYVAAIEIFYKDSDKLDHRSRALAYEKAMEQLQARFPDDQEAAIFHALALLATAPPSDKTYANQRKAGGIWRRFLCSSPTTRE